MLQTEGLRKDVSVIREALAAVVPAMAPSIGEGVASKLMQELALTDGTAALQPSGSAQPAQGVRADSAVNKLIESLRAQRQAGGSSTSDSAVSPSDTTASSPLLQLEQKADNEEDQDAGVDAEAVREAAVRQIQEALSGLLAANEREAVLTAVDQLKMYLNNIVSQPDNVRYRRVYTGNAMFKEALGKASNHQLLLEACGFEKKGSHYEWGACVWRRAVGIRCRGWFVAHCFARYASVGC